MADPAGCTLDRARGVARKQKVELAWSAIGKKMTDLISHVRDNPPSCVERFRTSSCEHELGTLNTVSYELTCPCGNRQGRVLGYSLETLNGKYSGPLTYVGPIAFECSNCKSLEEIIDTAKTGMHGMSGHSSVLRGTGARDAFRCLTCSSQHFELCSAFGYSEACGDLHEARPDLAIENYFTGFGLFGKCISCRRVNEIACLDL